ncbi:hypothetical protein E2C01_017592 [Portunus trituberculatus]|uniref:Uncharacterized protein n=1 Tax=Portunus trituberculatus TaxID=210409 RepID=A0A5B7DTX1_PORTR|nr:hypothetical protein [Portunus trituberculatus]
MFEHQVPATQPTLIKTAFLLKSKSSAQLPVTSHNLGSEKSRKEDEDVDEQEKAEAEAEAEEEEEEEEEEDQEEEEERCRYV